MGMARNIAIFTMLQAQQQSAQQAQKQAQQAQQAQQGTAQTSGNTAGQVDNKGVYGVGGETTSFNAGLLTYKKGKKEASQKLGTNNFAAIDEHQGQVLLG